MGMPIPAATLAPPPQSEQASIDTRARDAAEQLERRARVYFNRGVLKQSPDAFERATACLQLAMTLSPAPGLVFNRAVVEQRLGHCADASNLFSRFLSIAPSSPSRARAEAAIVDLADCAKQSPGESAFSMPGRSLELMLPEARIEAGPVQWEELPSDLPTVEAHLEARATEKRKVWLWTLGGATAMSLVVTSILFIETWLAHDRLERALRLGHSGDISRLRDRGEALQLYTRLSAGFTGALGGATALSLFLLPTDAEALENTSARHGWTASTAYTLRF